jgi:hypothetical protein
MLQANLLVSLRLDIIKALSTMEIACRLKRSYLQILNLIWYPSHLHNHATRDTHHDEHHVEGTDTSDIETRSSTPETKFIGCDQEGGGDPWFTLGFTRSQKVTHKFVCYLHRPFSYYVLVLWCIDTESKILTIEIPLETLEHPMISYTSIITHRYLKSLTYHRDST